MLITKEFMTLVYRFLMTYKFNEPSKGSIKKLNLHQYNSPLYELPLIEVYVDVCPNVFVCFFFFSKFLLLKSCKSLLEKKELHYKPTENFHKLINQ